MPFRRLHIPMTVQQWEIPTMQRNTSLKEDVFLECFAALAFNPSLCVTGLSVSPRKAPPPRVLTPHLVYWGDQSEDFTVSSPESVITNKPKQLQKVIKEKEMEQVIWAPNFWKVVFLSLSPIKVAFLISCCQHEKQQLLAGIHCLPHDPPIILGLAHVPRCCLKHGGCGWFTGGQARLAKKFDILEKLWTVTKTYAYSSHFSGDGGMFVCMH